MANTMNVWGSIPKNSEPDGWDLNIDIKQDGIKHLFELDKETALDILGKDVTRYNRAWWAVGLTDDNNMVVIQIYDFDFILKIVDMFQYEEHIHRKGRGYRVASQGVTFIEID